MAAMIVQMAISRTREYAADNLGARIGGRHAARFHGRVLARIEGRQRHVRRIDWRLAVSLRCPSKQSFL